MAIFRATPYFTAAAAIAAACLVLPAAADSGVWTLESVTRRAIEVAPEIRAAGAEVQARAGELDRKSVV